MVADALALGAHWLYDQNEIARRFGRVAEFLPPARDDYHPGKLRGAQTHYGDQTLVLLESLDACDGNFVMEDFAHRWSCFWRESNAYRDHATKITLAHLEESFDPPRAGSDSTDLGGAVRIAPLLAALRNENQPTKIAAAREQTMLTHAAPVTMDAAEFLTRMVLVLMRGESVASALQMTAALSSEALPVEAMLRQAESTHDLPTTRPWRIWDSPVHWKNRFPPSSLSSCAMGITSRRRSSRMSWLVATPPRAEWRWASSLAPLMATAPFRSAGLRDFLPGHGWRAF
jgi:ADP-ribosylglycohydrolase